MTDSSRIRDLVTMTSTGKHTLGDEALFTARHDTPEGQRTLQELHDTAARGGAVCNKPASMASQHEASAVQQVHDEAVAGGAKCSSTSGGRPYFSADAVAVAAALKAITADAAAAKTKRLAEMTAFGRQVMADPGKDQKP